MSELNPYAPPESEIIAPASTAIWREGKRLVIGRAAVFPKRCVKCNAPATAPAMYLLQYATALHVGLCDFHARRKQRSDFIQSVSLRAMIVLVMAGSLLKLSSGWTGPGMFLLWLAHVLPAARGIRTVRANQSMVWIEGCGQEFLNSFPDSAESSSNLPATEAPQVAQTTPNNEIWRENDLLVFGRNARFPERCVYCNGPIASALLHDLKWPRFRQTEHAVIHVGICQEHLRRVRWRQRITVFGFYGVYALIAVGVLRRPEPLWFCPLMLVACYLAFFGRSLAAARIDKSTIWLKGCGTAFLDSIPVSPQN
jgi:hypothetical protein